MTTPTPAISGPPTPAETPPTARRRVPPVVLGVASALLLWMAFPPVDRGYLAWFALVPLFALVRSDRPRWEVYLAAWLSGLVFWHLAVAWVRLTDPSAWLAWVAMATFLALGWPLFLLVARSAVRGLSLPLMLVAPVAWVADEYYRGWALTGLPWFFLGHAQYRVLPLIQVADLAGAWGVSLVVALVNAWFVDLVDLPRGQRTGRGWRPTRSQVVRAAIVASALLSVLGYGMVRLRMAQFRPGPRLALLQSDIRQELKMRADAGEILAEFRGLVQSALPECPDLIVWPETAYPRGYPRIDPALDPQELDRQIKLIHPKGTVPFWREKVTLVRRELNGLVDQLGIPMVVGATTYAFRPEGLARYNSAVLFAPGRAETVSYHKIHLVPFGEYVPLLQTFPWLTRLTPYHGEFVPSLTPGARPSWFDWVGVRYAAAICFEDTVPDLVRRSFAEVPDGHQPDVLLNISNDGWFRGSPELALHLIAGAFRAVENRVPIARAVNTGMTALIDGNGAVVRAVPPRTSAALTVTVPLDDRTSLYTTAGDWLPLACVLACLVALPLGLASDRRRRAAMTLLRPE